MHIFVLRLVPVTTSVWCRIASSISVGLLLFLVHFLPLRFAGCVPVFVFVLPFPIFRMSLSKFSSSIVSFFLFTFFFFVYTFPISPFVVFCVVSFLFLQSRRGLPFCFFLLFDRVFRLRNRMRVKYRKRLCLKAESR